MYMEIPRLSNLLPSVGYVVLLAVVSISFFTLSSTIINLTIGEADRFTHLVLESTRFALATFIVAFPILVFFIRYLERNGGIVHWAKALAFFVSAAIIIIDAIVVLAFFFNSGVTNAFILKAVVIFVLALLILGYNLNDASGFIAKISNRIRIIKYTAIVISVVCIVWIGSLIDILHAQDIEADKRVIITIVEAVALIDEYSRAKDSGVDNSVAPADASAIVSAKNCGSFNNKTCSNFPQSITYRRINNMSFSLCAEIKRNISIKLIDGRFHYHSNYRLIDWDGTIACFEFEYPIYRNYSYDRYYY